jgi:hypothetical protein
MSIREIIATAAIGDNGFSRELKIAIVRDHDRRARPLWEVGMMSSRTIAAKGSFGFIGEPSVWHTEELARKSANAQWLEARGEAFGYPTAATDDEDLGEYEFEMAQG